MNHINVMLFLAVLELAVVFMVMWTTFPSLGILGRNGNVPGGASFALEVYHSAMGPCAFFLNGLSLSHLPPVRAADAVLRIWRSGR